MGRTLRHSSQPQRLPRSPPADVAQPLTAAPAAAGPSALPAGVPYGAEITAAARKHGLDPALLAGLVRQESDFDPQAGSPSGARGRRPAEFGLRITEWSWPPAARTSSASRA